MKWVILRLWYITLKSFDFQDHFYPRVVFLNTIFSPTSSTRTEHFTSPGGAWGGDRTLPCPPKMLLKEWRKCRVIKRPMLSTGQDQGQVRWGHRMKIWDDCRVTRVLWVIWDVEFDGDTHCHIWRKVRSSSGQKGQISKLQIFIVKPYFVHFCLRIPKIRTSKFLWNHNLFIFVSGFQKYHLFWRTTMWSTNNCASKCDVITFTCFLPLHIQK